MTLNDFEQLNGLYFALFHPNRFTSGGVIAERLNIVKMHHKVFPILGEAIASSPSNTMCFARPDSRRNLGFLVFVSEREVRTHVHVRYMLSPVRLSVVCLSVCL